MSEVMEQHERWQLAQSRLGVRQTGSGVPRIRLPSPRPMPRVFGAVLDLYREPGWRNIVQLCALKHGVTFDAILDSRSQMATPARQHALFLLYTHTLWSWQQIAQKFGKDHSTVIYSVRAYIKRNPQGKAAYVAARLARADLTRDRAYVAPTESVSREAS